MKLGKIFERIIQTSKIKANEEYNIFHGSDYIYKTQLDQNGKLEIISQLDENKTLKELMDEKKVDIKSIFEIIPSNDKNNVIKIRLKRPQDFQDE